MQETKRQGLDPWVRKMPWHNMRRALTTHSSILARRIPWTEEPGGLWSMVGRGGSQSRTWLKQLSMHTRNFYTFCVFHTCSACSVLCLFCSWHFHSLKIILSLLYCRTHAMSPLSIHSQIITMILGTHSSINLFNISIYLIIINNLLNNKMF